MRAIEDQEGKTIIFLQSGDVHILVLSLVGQVLSRCLHVLHSQSGSLFDLTHSGHQCICFRLKFKVSTDPL